MSLDLINLAVSVIPDASNAITMRITAVMQSRSTIESLFGISLPFEERGPNDRLRRLRSGSFAFGRV